MKKVCLLLLIAFNCFTAAAFRIVAGENIAISQPVYEDLYIAGGTITINAPIHGDLIIAGGTIVINDSVMSDIILAGGNATFNGYVGDDIRCAAGNIYLQKNVAGDVVVTGGSAIINKGITIGGLISGGGNITIDGNINGEIKSASGNLILNGNVAKNIDCRGGKVLINGVVNGQSVLAAESLTIGDGAAFLGDVRYWSGQGTVNFKQSLKNGKATFDESLGMSKGKWYYLGSTAVLGLLWYLGTAMLMIFIIQYLFATSMKQAAQNVETGTLKSLGVGFLYFIVIPVVAVIAFVTLIGLPVGLLLLLGYIITLLLATSITSVVAANWINNRNNKNWTNGRLTLVATGLFILLKLLSFIPYIGWLLLFLGICVAFGSIVTGIKWKRTKAANVGVTP